jgi:hypothetical protein
MVPLYRARIEDLGPGDFVKVECMVCGHTEMIPAIGLVNGLRLPITPASAGSGASAAALP